MKKIEKLGIVLALLLSVGLLVACSGLSRNISYKVNVASVSNGSVVTSAASAVEGTTVTLTLMPAAGYSLRFLTVSKSTGESIPLSGSGNSRTFTMPASEVTVSASFEIVNYKVKLAGMNNGSIISSQGSPTVGSRVTLTASPSDGYGLKSLSVKDSSGRDLAVSGDGNARSFVMPASDVIVNAVFDRIYTVTITDSVNGRIVSSVEAAFKNDVVTLTVFPAEGYRLKRVDVSNGSTVSGDGNVRTFTMLASNVEVRATFVYCFHESVTILPPGTDGSAGTSAKYVLFGDWPQTVKPSDVVISGGISFSMGGNHIYEGSDGNYYVNCDENALGIGSKYTYSDGRQIGQRCESSEYFRVEPIKWRVLTESFDHDNDVTTQGKALLVAEKILIGGRQYHTNLRDRTIDGETIKPSNYEHSNLRAYLNGLREGRNDYGTSGFLVSAFTENAQDSIATTHVDNSVASTNPAANPNLWNSGVNNYACNDTNDKIFLLSIKEITTEVYGFDPDPDAEGVGNSRYLLATDYAKANYLNLSSNQDKEEVNAFWWLRSPNYQYSANARAVYSLGRIANGNADSKLYGIVPALALSLPSE
ncbi:MAG: DUF6273 domain-containing protein [Treponemataceae bacterium]|nr:DUF6273 domain-containing protein [Treponemataceae bacterium]